MRVRVLVVASVLLLAACWREPAPRTRPEVSFVARVHALADLRARTDALAPELDVAMQRILGLASEAERAALRDDLAALDAEVAQLRQIARAARERGDDPDLLASIETKLARATISLATLHDDLLHAKTLAEQEAFERLKKKTEGTLDQDGIRIQVFRRNTPGLPPLESPRIPLAP
jgi:hypothetical protein